MQIVSWLYRGGEVCLYALPAHLLKLPIGIKGALLYGGLSTAIREPLESLINRIENSDSDLSLAFSKLATFFTAASSSWALTNVILKPDSFNYSESLILSTSTIGVAVLLAFTPRWLGMCYIRNRGNL